DRVHQRFRHKLTAVFSKSSFRHYSPSFLIRSTIRRIFIGSFRPSVSAPLLTSRQKALCFSASARFSSRRPPAKKNGFSRSGISDQSKRRPVPPYARVL